MSERVEIALTLRCARCGERVTNALLPLSKDLNVAELTSRHACRESVVGGVAAIDFNVTVELKD